MVLRHADVQELVATGNWRDPRSAMRYAHLWVACQARGKNGKGSQRVKVYNKINKGTFLPQSLAATFLGYRNAGPKP
jgi:hypothetical protein